MDNQSPPPSPAGERIEIVSQPTEEEPGIVEAEDGAEKEGVVSDLSDSGGGKEQDV
jgi:hypothetical protein